MIQRIIKIVWNEFIKLISQKFTYFSLIALIILVILIGIGVNYFSIEQSTIGSGYLFLLSSVRTVISLFGVIFILIFSSQLISSESSSGTLQVNLVNPIKRFEFYAAKLIISIFFAMTILAITLLASIVIIRINYSFGDYVERGLTIFTQGDIFLNLFLCSLLLFFPLLSICCYGLLISTITKNSGTAIGYSIGSIIIIDVIKERFNISDIVFNSYIDTPFELAQQITEGFKINWMPTILYCIFIPMIWAIIMAGTGYFIFSKRDFK